MDTSTHFYYCVTGTLRCTDGDTRLCGCGFRAGLSASEIPHLKRDIYIIDAGGRQLLSGELMLEHQQGLATVLILRNHHALTGPCLLTSNPEMNWKFSRLVNVTDSHGTLGHEDVPDWGLPLQGPDWLGVLRRAELALRLDAYASSVVSLGRILSAFCPEFAECADEESMTVTLQTGETSNSSR